jgi:hypothetical protein
MRINLVIALLFVAYFAWVTWQLERQQKAERRRQRELDADWNLRKAILRGRQTWPKA